MRRSRRSTFATVAVAAALAAGGCTYPQDPRGSFDDAAGGGTLRVVAVEHEPWVRISDAGEVTGVEAELVERFARDIDADVAWQPADAEAAVAALEHGAADLAVGGFVNSDPHAARVAATRPYVRTDVVLARPSSSSVAIDDADGRTILHDADDIAVAAVVRGAGGRPRPTEQLPPDGLAAVHHWQVAPWDLDRGIRLHRSSHVLFVERGENRLLSKLERFLDTQRDHALDLLEQEVRA